MRESRVPPAPVRQRGRLVIEDPRLEQAARVAVRLAGSYPLADSYHRLALEEAAPGLVERAGRLVEEETGLSGGGPPAVAVVDRRAWIERNLAFSRRSCTPPKRRWAGGWRKRGSARASPNA